MKDTKGAARAVVTRSPKRKVGIINCKWFQDLAIQHESQLEKRFVQRSLLCLDVKRVEHQPFTLHLKKGRYTPDFLLTFGNGQRLVVEVKISSKVKKNFEKFNEAAAALSEKQMRFYVLTQHVIDKADHPEIASEILRYGKSQLAASELDRVEGVMKQLPAGQEVIMAQLLATSGSSLEVILHLMARRQLVLNEDDYIGDDARISRVRDDQPAGFLSFEKHFAVLPWQPDGSSLCEQKKVREGLRRRPTKKGPYLRPAPARPSTLVTHPLRSLAGGLPSHRSRSQGSTSGAD